MKPLEKVEMERTKLRSWMLHCAVSHKLSNGLTDSDWTRLQRKLDWVRERTGGPTHVRNMDQWQQLIDDRYEQKL